MKKTVFVFCAGTVVSNSAALGDFFKMSMRLGQICVLPNPKVIGEKILQMEGRKLDGGVEKAFEYGLAFYHELAKVALPDSSVQKNIMREVNKPSDISQFAADIYHPRCSRGGLLALYPGANTRLCSCVAGNMVARHADAASLMFLDNKAIVRMINNVPFGPYSKGYTYRLLEALRLARRHFKGDVWLVRQSAAICEKVLDGKLPERSDDAIKF